MSNYPAGSDTPQAPWNQPDSADISKRCDICRREVVSADDACSWRCVYTGKIADAYTTPGNRFVCSAACNSQAMYEAATEEERAALRMLAKWNESIGMLQQAFLERNPYQKTLDIRYGTVWERWNNPYNILKLHALVEKIGADLTGADEAPEWYAEAIAPAVAE